MRFVSIIVLFCLAVAGCAVLAKYWLRGSVEAEMEECALAVLREGGFPEVTVDFDHLSGRIGGNVVDPGDRKTVLLLLQEKVPTAYWAEGAEMSIAIRPTVPPSLRVARLSGSDEVTIDGTLSMEDEAARTMLGTRLHALAGIAKVNNLIKLDPKVMLFPKMAEFSSIASGLLAHSEAAEIALQEEVVTLVGSVPNDGLKSGLMELAAQITGKAALDKIEVSILKSSLAGGDMKMTRNRFGITLSGVIGDENSRGAILSLVAEAQPTAAVIDRITVSDERSRSAWQDALPQLLPVLLTNLEGEMTAEFTPDRVRVNGSTATVENGDRITAVLGAVAAGPTPLEILNEVSIRSEEEAGDKGIEFTATYDADLLILKGNLEGESTFADIEAKLTGIRSSLSVKNELSVSAVRPGSEWVAKLPDFFAEVVGRTKSGVFAFGRDRVELTGRTIEIADRMILQNITVNTVPSSFLVKNELLHMDEPLPLVPISAEAAAEVNAALKELPVYFESGSSILTEEGRSKIAGVVERLKKANAEYALILTGVSDNIGNAATNKELSLARADSVVKELVKLEIPESVIEVTSEVENVSNLPRSQRWKSRRVDFSLKSTSRGSAPPAAEPR